MKNVFHILFLLAFSSPLWSQTEKGSHYLGTTANLTGQGVGTPGVAGFAFGKRSSKTNQTDQYTTEKTTAFNFSPTYGYFLTNGFALGVTAGMSFYSTEQEDKTVYKNTGFSAGPFLRYYLNAGKKVQPFAEIRGGFMSGIFKGRYLGNDLNKFEDKNNGSYFGGRVGGAFFLGAKTSLDLFIDYSNSRIESSSEFDAGRIEQTDKNGVFGLGLGFTFLL